MGVGEGKVRDAILRCGGYKVDHSSHLVEFFGANIWAVREAEVDLENDV